MKLFTKKQAEKLIDTYGTSKYMGVMQTIKALKIGQCIGLECGKDKLDNGEFIGSVAIDAIRQLARKLGLNIKVFVKQNSRTEKIGVKKSENTIFVQKRGNENNIHPTLSETNKTRMLELLKK